MNTQLIPVFFLIWLFAITGAAQPEHLKTDAKFAFGNQRQMKMPAEFGSHILLRVKLNNGPECFFAIDTGSSFNVVTPAAVEQLGLKTKKGKAYGFSKVKLTVADLHSGDLTITGIPFVLTSAPIIGSIDGRRKYLAGVLGYDFIRRFVMEVDYPRQILILHNPTTYREPDSDSSAAAHAFVPLALDGGTALASLNLSPVDSGTPLTVKALIDTGSPDSFWGSEKFAPGFNQLGRTYRAELGGFFLGRLNFLNERPAGSQFKQNFDVLIGNPSLKAYKAIFDYENNRLTLLSEPLNQ